MRVWVGRVPDTAAPADLALLDGPEARRLAEFRDPVAAARYAGARAAVRRTAAGFLGVGPREVVWDRGPCPGCGDLRHGPPRLRRPDTGWRVGVSRSGPWWVLALSPGAAVGVDVEARGPQRVPAVVRRCLSPAERAHLAALPEGPERDDAFTRCWVRKEAVVKGWGVGVATDLARVEVRPWTGAAVVAGREAGAPDGGDWEVRDLDAGAGCLAALALPAGFRPPVAVHRAAEERPAG